MKKFKSKFVLDGKTYECEVIDGVRYVEGKMVDEFFETLADDQKLRFARVGKMALDGEKRGIKPPKKKYQYYINEPL